MMWAVIARFILRNRILLLVLLGLVTAFMGYKARDVKLMYGLPDLLPKTDSVRLAFNEFQKLYGGEGSIYIIGIEEDPLEDLSLFNGWYRLSEDLQSIKGVDTIISVSKIFTLRKDTSARRFRLTPVVTSELHNEAELDSVRSIIHSLPFYKGLLYNDSTHATLMAVTMDSSLFNSGQRLPLISKIMNKVARFSEENKVKVHYSGLPFVRTIITRMVKSEMVIFITIAALLTMLLLFIFFRSFKPVTISMLVVLIGVIWTLGCLSIFGYKITILTGMLPSLIIVIGVANCIFLINKYHYEFKVHGNQAKALVRVIQKVGNATFMTNATTAIGFVTFIFTGSTSLKEFGVVSAVNIMGLFLISLLVIPIVFSYLPPPGYKHTKHLERKIVNAFVNKLVYWVSYHRR
ncbi:MAG: RND family transporter, partial [Flavobacteriales bacterium]